jgi:hypothetical protein
MLPLVRRVVVAGIALLAFAALASIVVQERRSIRDELPPRVESNDARTGQAVRDQKRLKDLKRLRAQGGNRCNGWGHVHQTIWCFNTPPEKSTEPARN